MTHRLIAGAGVLIVLASATTRCLAQESIAQEEPPPASVQQSTTPMERSFGPVPERPGHFPRLREQLQGAPPFFRDMKLDLNLRTYFFNGETFDGARPEAWAGGAALSYRSGWLFDRLSVGAVLYTSQPLHAPDGHDGTGLLKSGQHGYTVLGQLYARVKVFDEQYLKLYRTTYDTPYLSHDDSRMTPKTFEGYVWQGSVGGEHGEPRFRYGGGYITKMKDNNSDEFVSMSRSAGATVDRGVGVAGASFSYGGLSIGAIDYYCDDTINIGYGEAKYVQTLGEELGLLVAAQFTDQRSVGADRLTGFSFSTNQLGIKAEVSYGGAVFTLAHSRNDDGADLREPWSGSPGYTSVMVRGFESAGEKAVLAKISYDFSRVGVPGFTMYGLVVHGWGRVDPTTGAPVANVNEVDADVQWRPRWGFLEGLWLRARYAFVKQYEGAKEAIHDVRLIVNYDIPLL